MRELIKQCAARDAEAWRRLSRLAESAARFQILLILSSRHLDAHLVDDIMQELLVHLHADSCCRLRTFRGHTEAELRGFLRTTAVRLALRFVYRLQRKAVCERAALAEMRVPERSGPSERQVLQFRRELEASLSEQQRHRLAVVAGDREYLRKLNGNRPAESTLRRWRREVFELVKKHVS